MLALVSIARSVGKGLLKDDKAQKLALQHWLEALDKVVNEAIKMFYANDGKSVKEEEFKKLLTEILGSVMLQLQGNPVSVFIHSVVHEPLLLQQRSWKHLLHPHHHTSSRWRKTYQLS